MYPGVLAVSMREYVYPVFELDHTAIATDKAVAAVEALRARNPARRQRLRAVRVDRRERRAPREAVEQVGQRLLREGCARELVAVSLHVGVPRSESHALVFRLGADPPGREQRARGVRYPRRREHGPVVVVEVSPEPVPVCCIKAFCLSRWPIWRKVPCLDDVILLTCGRYADALRALGICSSG